MIHQSVTFKLTSYSSYPYFDEFMLINAVMSKFLMMDILIAGLLVVSLSVWCSGLFMKTLALLTIWVFRLWLISLRCHSFKMLQHKEGQLYNQMMVWQQAPWASAMKYTFKDQIARKEERRLGGEKRNQSLRDLWMITKHLMCIIRVPEPQEKVQ